MKNEEGEAGGDLDWRVLVGLLVLDGESTVVKVTLLGTVLEDEIGRAHV